jgi:hypothetical protein
MSVPVVTRRGNLPGLSGRRGPGAHWVVACAKCFRFELHFRRSEMERTGISIPVSIPICFASRVNLSEASGTGLEKLLEFALVPL